jgi:hypothetical protein
VSGITDHHDAKPLSKMSGTLWSFWVDLCHWAQYDRLSMALGCTAGKLYRCVQRGRRTMRSRFCDLLTK